MLNGEVRDLADKVFASQSRMAKIEADHKEHCDRCAALEKRLAELEARVSALEPKTPPAPSPLSE